MEAILYISLIINFLTVPPIAFIIYWMFKLRKSGLMKREVLQPAIKAMFQGRSKQLGVDYETYKKVMGDENQLIESSDLLKFLEGEKDE